jgi:hypothetical protein
MMKVNLKYHPKSNDDFKSNLLLYFETFIDQS